MCKICVPKSRVLNKDCLLYQIVLNSANVSDVEFPEGFDHMLFCVIAQTIRQYFGNVNDLQS